MPLPDKFYNVDGKEVSLEQLCKEDYAWASNRIRQLTKTVDDYLSIMGAMKTDICCGNDGKTQGRIK